MKVKGWNESLMVYVLAASSPTHSVEADVYHQGWASNGSISNSAAVTMEIELPLGPELRGPLFFAHYSFIGLDPQKSK